LNISQRPIDFAPAYKINYDGVVFLEKCVVPTTSIESRKGVQMLAVEINGAKYPVWKLMSIVWEGNRLLLPRDGNFMRWDEQNRIVLRELSSGAITDQDEIHKIWFDYQWRNRKCYEMPHKYTVNQYHSLVCDVLYASVR